MSEVAKYESMIDPTQLVHAKFPCCKTKFVPQFDAILPSLTLVPILRFPYSHNNFHLHSPEILTGGGGGGGGGYDRS